MPNAPTLQQLQQAVLISQKIESLQAELAAIFDPTVVIEETTVVFPMDEVIIEEEIEETEPDTENTPMVKRRGRPPGSGRKKRTISAAHREAIAAAQKKRWAKAEAGTAKAPKPAKKKKKGGMSEEGRARIAEAQRRRWAAFAKKKKA